MTSTFFIELRRSPIRWWVPFLLVVDLAALFGRGRWWIGVWPQASAAAQLPAQFVAPLVAAAAAWSAARGSRSHTIDRVEASVRPAWQADAIQLSVTALYGLAPYVAGAAAAAAVSLPEAGPGFLWPGYLLLGASVIVACAAVGHAVGRSVDSAYAAPVLCGLGCFLAIGVLGDPRSLGLSLLDGNPDVGLSGPAIAARAAGALALAVAAVVLPSAIGRRRRSWAPGPRARAATAGSILVVLAAGWGVSSAPAVTVQRTAPRTPACSLVPPRVCVWPEDGKYLSQISTLAQRLSAIPGHILVLPPTFYERGLRSGGAAANDFRVVEGSMWSVSPSLAASVLQATLPSYCSAASSELENRRTLAYFELSTWLEARANGAGQPADVHGGPPGVDLAAMGRLIKQPEHVQSSWVAARLGTIRQTPCG